MLKHKSAEYRVAKYKSRYLNAKRELAKYKNMRGGVYDGITYLGQGAESMVFKMSDGKALKIIKNHADRIKDSERLVIEAVKDVAGFPKIYAIGTCRNVTGPISEATSFCSGEGDEYQYVIMDTIDGKDMLEIFYEKFKDYINADVVNVTDVRVVSLLTEFEGFYIEVIKKVAEALKRANDAVKFRHNDLDFRNCLITSAGEPTIIDFGQSTINVGAEIECKDMKSYVSSFVNGGYCNRKETIEKVYGIKEPSAEMTTKCVKNCKDILTKFKTLPRISQVARLMTDGCAPYMGTEIKLNALVERLRGI
jgi:hypothetical protein